MTTGPKITASSSDGAILIRIEAASVAPPDELVALAESGLETKAWQRLVRDGELPARRIGRRWYTTRSAIVGLVRAAPRETRHGPGDDFARVVAGERRRA